jgi:hypothetical protein
MGGFAIWVLRTLVRRASDAQLERLFGLGTVQRAIFAVMARRFDARAAAGFEGDVVYELRRPESSRPPRLWTLEVLGGRAKARPAGAPSPALTIRIRLADFVRIAAGTLDPALPLLRNRGSITGDLALAARVPEMFRAPRPV